MEGDPIIEAPSSYVVSTPVAGVGQEDGPDSSIGAISPRGLQKLCHCLKVCQTFQSLYLSIRFDETRVNTLEFSPNIFHWIQWNILLKWWLELTTSCVRGGDDTTAPWRHRLQRGSLNWPKFMFHWFARFPEFTEFLSHLGKTQLLSLIFLSLIVNVLAWTTLN